MRPNIFLTLATALPFTVNAAETNSPVKLPAREKFHLYLLMGQSNMAGRGKIEAEDKTPHPRVFMLTTNAIWQPAVEPITHDKPKVLGVGPGFAFGKVMAEKNSEATIGLIPCAFGGTPLSRWQKGGDLYSNAVRRAKLAMKDGTIKGVLWHQGENDSGNRKTAETYARRLDQMIRDLRAELGAPKLPFVAGQLGEFLLTRTNKDIACVKLVNEAIAELPSRVPHTGCAQAMGLTHKGDQVHFDAASERELGRRFAAEMIRLQQR